MQFFSQHQINSRCRIFSEVQSQTHVSAQRVRLLVGHSTLIPPPQGFILASFCGICKNLIAFINCLINQAANNNLHHPLTVILRLHSHQPASYLQVPQSQGTINAKLNCLAGRSTPSASASARNQPSAQSFQVTTHEGFKERKVEPGASVCLCI